MMKRALTTWILLGSWTLGTAVVSAQTTWTWIGAGGTATDPRSGNWFTSPSGQHWEDGTEPASASDTVLRFGSGTVAYASTNNWASAFTLNQIHFAQGAGTAQVDIRGSPLSFGGDGAGIYYAPTGDPNFYLGTSLTADTLILNSTRRNNNFRVNVQNANNSITVNNLIISGTGSAGWGRASIRGTQNNIGQITIKTNGELNVFDSFSTTAPVNFEGDGIITKTSYASYNFIVGGWQSVTSGAGRITLGTTNGAGGFEVRVADNETYEFSGIIGTFTGHTAAANTRTWIIKSGNGTQILSGQMTSVGENGYPQIRVDGGRLVLASSGTVAGSGNRTIINKGGTFQVDGLIGAGSGVVQVNPGGRLAGKGEIRRPVTVSSNATDQGILQPGWDTVGTLTINGSLTLDDRFRMVLNIDSGGASRVNIIGSSPTLTLNGTHTSASVIEVKSLDSTPLSLNTVIFSFGTLVDNGNAPGGVLPWTVTGDVGSGWYAKVDGNNIVLIPEPQTLALGAVGLIAMRLRRRLARQL